MNLFMLFMTIILAMVDPDLLRSISASRATAQGCQVLPAKNVLPTYRSKSTQNVLEASQIKKILLAILANVLKVIIFEGIFFCCCFSSEMHCVCV